MKRCSIKSGHSSISLTKRETESFFSHERNVHKKIAGILKLSPRTVDDYVAVFKDVDAGTLQSLTSYGKNVWIGKLSHKMKHGA